MESFRPAVLRLALLLARHVPAAGLLRLARIAHIQDDKDIAGIAWLSSRQIRVAAARIGIAVRATCAGLPVRELFRIDRVADVPDENAFILRLCRIGTACSH